MSLWLFLHLNDRSFIIAPKIKPLARCSLLKNRPWSLLENWPPVEYDMKMEWNAINSLINFHYKILHEALCDLSRQSRDMANNTSNLWRINIVSIICHIIDIQMYMKKPEDVHTTNKNKYIENIYQSFSLKKIFQNENPNWNLALCDNYLHNQVFTTISHMQTCKKCRMFIILVIEKNLNINVTYTLILISNIQRWMQKIQYMLQHILYCYKTYFQSKIYVL